MPTQSQKRSANINAISPIPIEVMSVVQKVLSHAWQMLMKE